jgi:adenylate cyclase
MSVSSARRLAAIMFTDMVGYSALSQSDESQALQVLERHNRLLRPFFSRFGGKEIKTIGDSFLVEFESALDATNCATKIQEYLHDYNLSSQDDWKIKLRIGIHLGDVVHQDNDILGDAVNIASRIQPLAEPEGVCISEQVYYQIRSKTDYAFEQLEQTELKNIKFPTNIYKIVMAWQIEKGNQIVTADKVSLLDKKRIAVLPFTNISSDPNDEYFADGMTEELISTISQIGDLTVISRTSVMQYKKNTTKSVADIGRELNVGSLIEGSARKFGNRVRVAVQLIEVESDKHLWSHSYDSSLEDIFSIQSEIARSVAESLKVKLLAKEKERIEKIPTSSVEAHDMYLRGLFFYEKFNKEGLEQAIRCFELAIEKDPSYALAYAEMASSYSLLGFFEIHPSIGALGKAKKYAEKALALDPLLVEARIVISNVLANSWKFADAEAESRRALELNPNLAIGHRSLSMSLMMMRKYDESLSEANMALKLDPKSPLTQAIAATACLYAGEYDDAILHFRAALEMNPDITLARDNLGLCYVQKGIFDVGISEIKKAIELSHGSNPSQINDLAYAFVKTGRVNEARGLLTELLEMRENNKEPRAATAIAGIYSSLGEIEKSLEWLERAYEEHSGFLRSINSDFIFDNLRPDPRFQALLKKIGFPDVS